MARASSTLKASALWPLIIEATSHPSLFAFSEILSVPTVSELQGTENSLYPMFFDCLLTEPGLTTKEGCEAPYSGLGLNSFTTARPSLYQAPNSKPTIILTGTHH
ncbi:hypothetical protein OIU84_021941 [Salix udensis]|uniref:Uncharacterized protein n=1 Tax=Salix udensis TaxID=889485 RepID=A0AAD6KXC5_9ROSI|nr:hypothetical protein OIU84_021941 [Salix udensis]